MRIFLTLLVAGTLAGGGVSAAETFAVDRPGWASACLTYENRARFLPREAPVAFVVTLAEVCEGAMTSLDSGRPQERDAAARLLARVRELRDIVVRMNIERIYGRDPWPWDQPRRAPAAMHQVAQVSAAGEYLIARHIGVVAALDSWLDTGPAYSLASR